MGSSHSPSSWTSQEPTQSAPSVVATALKKWCNSAWKSSVDDSARLTESSVCVSASFTCVWRASSAFSMARPTWAATPSSSRTSAGSNTCPVRHQTRKRPPPEEGQQIPGHVVAADGEEPLLALVEQVGAHHVGAEGARDLGRDPPHHVAPGVRLREHASHREQRGGLAQPLLRLRVEPRVLQREGDLAYHG